MLLKLGLEFEKATVENACNTFILVKSQFLRESNHDLIS